MRAISVRPRFVLLVGEPGIGKSRLVQELLAHVDGRPEMIIWRQGRCLSYGEGAAFSALAEIVKAHAGILESDDAASVEAKLEDVLPAGEDRPWFRQRLRALLGLDAPKAEREENFTAWLRFLEGIATRDPAVLVIEDLHWADDALLDFLGFLVVHASHVALMVVTTARPELFERVPSFAAADWVDRIDLEPLSQEETAELVSLILDESGASLRTSIALQAQGNPFYAEESARLAREQTGGRRASLLPGSVQAVIAARLDALPVDVKAVLSDAAVAGDVFWDGLLLALGDPQRAGGARGLG